MDEIFPWNSERIWCCWLPHLLGKKIHILAIFQLPWNCKIHYEDCMSRQDLPDNAEGSCSAKRMFWTTLLSLLPLQLGEKMDCEMCLFFFQQWKLLDVGQLFLVWRLDGVTLQISWITGWVAFWPLTPAACPVSHIPLTKPVILALRQIRNTKLKNWSERCSLNFRHPFLDFT